jgi:hypothetical protein
MSQRRDAVTVTIDHRRDQRKTATVKLVGWTIDELEALAHDLGNLDGFPHRLGAGKRGLIARALARALSL